MLSFSIKKKKKKNRGVPTTYILGLKIFKEGAVFFVSIHGVLECFTSTLGKTHQDKQYRSHWPILERKSFSGLKVLKLKIFNFFLKKISSKMCFYSGLGYKFLPQAKKVPIMSALLSNFKHVIRI